MKIYHYDESGNLVGEGVADPDPLQTGAWLIPAQATTSKPPQLAMTGHRIVFNGSEWVQQALPEPTPESAASEPSASEIRRAEIMAELSRIDQASTRPARAVAYAIANGNQADAADVAQLGALEAQAQSLRAELKALA